MILSLSALSHEEFMEVIDASGIDEDGDGSLSKDEFLTFLGGLFLENIPSREVESLRQAYDAAVALAPDEPMNDARVESLFKDLGFDMKSSNMGDVIGVIDADEDGDVDFDEFLTGIGMMKKMTLLSKQLDAAFSNYKNQSVIAKQQLRRRSTMEKEAQAAPSRRNLLSSGITAIAKMSTRNINSSQKQLQVEDDSDEEGVELDASDLMAFLNVERDLAEEMVFLADQDDVEVEKKDSDGDSTGGSVKCYRSIDRAEFQQMIREWS